MILAGVGLVVACAVLPWLIPWQSFQASLAEPPVPIGESDSPGADSSPTATPSASAEEAPSEQDVRELAKKMKDGSAAGYDLPVDPREVSSVQTDPGEYRKLGRISIPGVDLDVTFGEGVYGEPLERGPGHWPGTPMPGSRGNAVLSGHRNTHTQPFKELDEVAKGDTIETTLRGGRSTTFTVIETAIVPESEYKEFVLKQPSGSKRQITLFACHPEGNPIYRIVVRAEHRS